MTATLGSARRRDVRSAIASVHPEGAERLRGWGHEDFTSYVVWACQQGLERGLLPHTNLGVLSREDLSRLREVTADPGEDPSLVLLTIRYEHARDATEGLILLPFSLGG